MTSKDKKEVLGALVDKLWNGSYEQKLSLGEVLGAIDTIPEEEHENVSCVKPNYEVMYHEAMKKLENSEFAQENMRNEIQQVHFANARLVGFKEAVELIFRKDCDCHGRTDT